MNELEIILPSYNVLCDDNILVFIIGQLDTASQLRLQLVCKAWRDRIVPLAM